MAEEQAFNPQGKNVSANEVQNYLRGVDYPASKYDLVNKAQEQGAPQEVIDMLEQMPEQEYGNPQELMKHFEE